MDNDALVGHKGGESSVVGSALVGFTVLIPTLGDVGDRQGGNARDIAEEIVDYVSPVAEHIEENAAALFLAVIPEWALNGLEIAFKYSIAEFPAHLYNFPE